MTFVTEPALFEAEIVPHRSLSRQGVNRLIFALAVICCINATVFIHIGAWPVGGFTGVELLLAGVLLRLNSHAARAREVVRLTPEGLRITRVSRHGQRDVRVLPPGWLNVEFVERPGRVSALWLVAHGVREEIGRSLGEEPKRELGQSLEAALRRWRNPVFDNPQLRE